MRGYKIMSLCDLWIAPRGDPERFVEMRKLILILSEKTSTPFHSNALIFSRLNRIRVCL